MPAWCSAGAPGGPCSTTEPQPVKPCWRPSGADDTTHPAEDRTGSDIERRPREAPGPPPRGSGQGTVTGWMTTGPRVGSSSVACETPCGVITSTAFGTVPGSTWQIEAVPPGAHTPNWNGCGVAAKPRA